MLLLFGDLEVGEHEESDGYLQMACLGALTERIFQFVKKCEDIVNVVVAGQVDWL